MIQAPADPHLVTLGVCVFPDARDVVILLTSKVVRPPLRACPSACLGGRLRLDLFEIHLARSRQLFELPRSALGERHLVERAQPGLVVTEERRLETAFIPFVVVLAPGRGTRRGPRLGAVVFVVAGHGGRHLPCRRVRPVREHGNRTAGLCRQVLGDLLAFGRRQGVFGEQRVLWSRGLGAGTGGILALVERTRALVGMLREQVVAGSVATREGPRSLGAVNPHAFCNGPGRLLDLGLLVRLVQVVSSH
jgi:hypothetical protein